MSVAIIGGGPAGLTSAKTAIENGLDPTVFDKSAEIGGLWKPQVGSVWERMRTNISHHTCSFSDFPWPASTDDFPNARQVHQYLESYAEYFKLSSHIQLNSSVNKVTPMGEKWVVEWIRDGKNHSQVFDHILVCSGVFSKPFVPQIPGIEKFQGKVLHSNDYKKPDDFAGKKIIVVGNAFSGCEIASELSTTAQKVIHVVRRPIWILSRYLSKPGNESQKIPGDLLFYSRASNARSLGVAPDVLNAAKHAWFASTTKQNDCKELKIDTNPTSPQFVAISDNYISQVTDNKIGVKKASLQRIEKDQIIYPDGTTEKADAIIFCTGYQADLPFLSQDVRNQLDFRPDDQLQPLLLHKTVFHPNLRNIAFIGLYRGPFFGIMELQARWACMVFSKKIAMPSENEMIEGIKNAKKIRATLPRPQFPRGDYVAFAEELAGEISAIPDFEKLKKENSDLYKKLWEGPFSTASYRLGGFGSNPEVALQILEKIYSAYSTQKP